MSEVELAKEAAENGDADGAIKTLSSLFDDDVAPPVFEILVGAALVEVLIGRGKPADLDAADVEIDRLAGIVVEPGFVLPDILLARLRALLARAQGDEGGYRKHKARYLAAATAAGYEGHIAKAEAMP